MNKNSKIASLIFGAFVLVVVIGLAFSACKKKDKGGSPWEEPYSPQPTADHCVPDSILPAALTDTVTRYMTIYSGDNPPSFNGLIQCVSHPHKLLFSNSPKDTIVGQIFADRYIAFNMRTSGYVDFYGKQWDQDSHKYYEEAFRNLVMLGTADKFTCYYLTEGFPNGLYACFSTVFSGRWNPSYGGIRDFQVAVILLETSGNPHLEPVNTFRVLGDADSLACDTAWMPRSVDFDNIDIDITDEELFRMFRLK